MSRIQKAFERLNGEGRKALIPFITAGDPSADLTVPLMHALVEAGVDVINWGCRSLTRWLTARPSSGRRSAHWRGA